MIDSPRNAQPPSGAGQPADCSGAPGGGSPSSAGAELRCRYDTPDGDGWRCTHPRGNDGFDTEPCTLREPCGLNPEAADARTRTAPPERISEWDPSPTGGPGWYWLAYADSPWIPPVPVHVGDEPPRPYAGGGRRIWHGPLSPPALPAGGR
jgi:hypothetical protein